MRVCGARDLRVRGWPKKNGVFLVVHEIKEKKKCAAGARREHSQALEEH